MVAEATRGWSSSMDMNASMWPSVQVPLELCDRPGSFDCCEFWRPRVERILATLQSELQRSSARRLPSFPPIVLVDPYWMARIVSPPDVEKRAAVFARSYGGSVQMWEGWCGSHSVREFHDPQLDELRRSLPYGLSRHAVVLFLCPKPDTGEHDLGQTLVRHIYIRSVLAGGLASSLALQSSVNPLPDDVVRLGSGWLKHLAGVFAHPTSREAETERSKLTVDIAQNDANELKPVQRAHAGPHFDSSGATDARTASPIPYWEDPRNWTSLSRERFPDAEPAAWSELIGALQGQRITVRLLANRPPEIPVPSGYVPSELDFLAEEDLEERRPFDVDRLGLYVPDSHGRTLPAGIHLFKSCIDAAQLTFPEARQRNRGPTENTLAWAVFWHELTHLLIDRAAASLPDMPTALQPVRLDEPFCELAALRALETGEHPLLPLRGPAFADAWRFEAWRLRQQAVPYRLFGNLIPAFEADPERLLDAVIGFLQTAPESVVDGVPAQRRKAAQKLVRESHDFQCGRVPPDEEGRLVRRLAHRARLATPMDPLQQPIVVYIWCGE
jgi:hypothetical protein